MILDLLRPLMKSVLSCKCSADVPSCMKTTPVAGPISLKTLLTRLSLLEAMSSGGDRKKGLTICL